MAYVTYQGTTVELRPGETLLDGLLRNGIHAAYSCRIGACLTCMSRAVVGRPPAAAQEGLTADERARGLFLACCCVPEEDLVVEPGY